jgi:hypothetical protein
VVSGGLLYESMTNRVTPGVKDFSYTLGEVRGGQVRGSNLPVTTSFF